MDVFSYFFSIQDKTIEVIVNAGYSQQSHIHLDSVSPLNRQNQNEKPIKCLTFQLFQLHSDIIKHPILHYRINNELFVVSI